MKKTLLFSLFFLAFANQIFAQTIRRVNNYPGVSGANVYSTIQAANDAAVDGDIIYIEPTGQSVGGLNCTKRLTIIGNGYLLDQNANTPGDKGSSIMGGITFNEGSSYSTLIGVDLIPSGIGTGINVYTNNITVTRCRLSGVNLVHYGLSMVPHSFTITKCLLNGTISYGYGPGSGYTLATGHIIANNIFSSTRAVSGLFNSIIVNNTMQGGNSIIYNVANTTISNNIFDFRSASPGSVVFTTNDDEIYTNNTFSNNICLAQNGLPAGNGNVNSASETTTFQVENPWLADFFGRGYYEKDATYQLAVSSPAKGIGTGGTDAGAFGGSAPYVLSGLPPYPIITNFTTSGVGNTSMPLQVSITVRSNN